MPRILLAVSNFSAGLSIGLLIFTWGLYPLFTVLNVVVLAVWAVATGVLFWMEG